MKFEAIALNDSLPKGRKSGHIIISEGLLSFLIDDVEVKRISLSGAKITQGGTGNRYVYFTHPDSSDWTFYTDDKTILNTPSIYNSTEHKAVSRKIKTNRSILKTIIYSSFFLVVMVFFSFFFFRSQIVESIAQQVPPQWEQEVSKSMLASILVDKTVLADSMLIKQLYLIADPLVAAVQNKDFKFSFTIIEDETLNAYALPGGAIVIHSGLILKADQVNEVAGVLAHEISHVTRRHHVRGMVDKLGFFVLLRAFIGDASGIGTEIALAGATLESLKYSRDYETEADNSGWELMLNANLNPDGMIAFFEKLQHEHPDLPEIASFMSTHPGTGERIATLKSKPLNENNFTEIDIDFEAFQKDISAHFNIENN